MKIYFKDYNLFALITLSLIIRIVAVYYYGDHEIENEWGVLLNNLYYNNVLAYRSFDNIIIPSVYMPPLYVFFLFFLKLISPENIEFVKIVLIFHVILSTLAILIFYHLSNFFFNKKWSIFNSLLFSIFPLNVYAATQISSATLQIFLITLYFYLFFLLYKQKKFNIKIIVFFSVTSGFMMLLRGEFYLIFIISLLWLAIFKKINFKTFITTFIISLLVITPYLIRNYNTFGKITLVKSIGYNLWKGNNQFSSVDGYICLSNKCLEAASAEAFIKVNIHEKIEKLPKDNLYDFHHDELFLQEALQYIKKEPAVFIQRYIKKVLTFYYFNIQSNYPNYYHPLFIIPIFLTSILSSLGIVISLKSLNFEKGYLLLYLFLTILIISVFFILPRYKIAILPIQIIFMNYFFLELYEKLSKSKSN